MFAAGKRGRLFLAAVLTGSLVPDPVARAAGFDSAVQALAAKTVALAGHGETVSISFKNISSLGPAEWSGVRSAFEAALRDAGNRLAETASVEARLTLSETPAQYLLVEEARRGEERLVWMAAWSREPRSDMKVSGPSLDLKQVWRQTEQILDVGFTPAGMLVLSPSKLSLYARDNDSWALRESVPITNPKAWPRDLRGRIRTTGAALQVFLPGLACNGNTAPTLTLDCRASEAPWVLESGSRGLLLAAYASARNYFDGRVVMQSGTRKTVAPFYSAAAADAQGRTFWVLAEIDGRAQILDGSFEPLGWIGQWGSDIAGIDARCGGGSQVLASRAGDAGEPDALQSFTIAERFATPVTAAALLPGPVTALWPSGASAAVAVARDLVSGDFIAYVASVSCAN